ncbi:response regulator transcription factor [Paenibacillus aquistagni]|uniref:response regulator transcription factor n=1 Tax=Paenibacillus aquistagni TaxID=1852522 RepID=UPI000B508D32|nr:helix-turn-helix domain-containing protein [Paenibacillus aquistagni]
MYRILIVDDDAIVVEGLYQLLAAHYENELDLCKAYGPEEALDIIMKTKLDIVISDIDMPGRSGLELADDLIRYWPKCRLLFLTGFSDFNYIYSAMKKRAAHFILKTEKDEHLLAVIQSVIDELEMERSNRDVLKQVSTELHYLRPLLTSEWLKALLDQSEKGAQVSTIRGHEWEIRENEPFMLLIGYTSWDQQQSWEAKVQSYGYVLNLFKEYVPPMLCSSGFVTHDSLFVWLIQPNTEEALFHNAAGSDNWEQIANYVKGFLEDIQNRMEHLLGLEVSFVFKREPLCFDSWKREFELLQQKAYQCMANSSHLTILDIGASRQDQQTERWVQEVHDFIEEHLGDDLSLVRIAEKVHMNPSYLSRYYKQVTGQNVSEYITETRLQAAKRWIVDEGMKFNEIAYRLGFNSPSYFTTFFKKQTGQTPQEYRDHYGK